MSHPLLHNQGHLCVYEMHEMCVSYKDMSWSIQSGYPTQTHHGFLNSTNAAHQPLPFAASDTLPGPSDHIPDIDVCKIHYDDYVFS